MLMQDHPITSENGLKRTESVQLTIHMYDLLLSGATYFSGIYVIKLPCRTQSLLLMQDHTYTII
jgi:hypothetical protein